MMDLKQVSKWDAVVIGGGFFGASIAIAEARRGKKVLLTEAKSDLMQLASSINQARIHGGYHYPRSFLTANRSRFNFKEFVEEFPSAVVSSFSMLYAIGREFSSVTARQFEEMCSRVGAPVREAKPEFAELFNSNLIEKVFEVEEYAFDSNFLREEILQRLESLGVCIQFGTRVLKAEERGSGLSIEYVTNAGKTGAIESKEGWLCTYSDVNQVLTNSGLPMIPLRHELAEVALVEPPPELKSIGITVVDGPFFSMMPFPMRGLHSLTHVRYTPHSSWSDDDGRSFDKMGSAELAYQQKNSAVQKMVLDARRFVPVIDRVSYSESLWATKTVLPRSEMNDSRPILLKFNHGLHGLHVVIGGKIDNVFDIQSVMADRVNV